MTDKNTPPYAIETIDAEEIHALETAALGILLRDFIHSMIPHAHQGLLEGSFELACEDAVTALREAAWQSVHEPEPFSLDAADLMDAKEDHELQEILGCVLSEASDRGDPEVYTPVRRMGADSCTFLAMEIEDWQTRYQLEECFGP